MKYRLTYYIFQIPESEIADKENRQVRILANRLTWEYKELDTDMLALAFWEIMPLFLEQACQRDQET
ncbi:MAG: hypothetical protein ACQERS_11260 [Bacteroidota bacterium]